MAAGKPKRTDAAADAASHGPVAAPHETATYIACTPISHGRIVEGKNVVTKCAPGDEIDLTAEEAGPLLGVLAVKPKPADAEATD